MAGQITDDFRATHRMADEGDVAKIEPFNHRGEIVGQRIEIVAAAGIGGTAVTPTIVGNTTQVLRC
jgi:hypothetical protein